MSLPGVSTASGFTALAGQFVLQPGQRESILGTRPIATAGLLRQLLIGQHFAATQARLGHLFSLCAHAHQRTCALAFGAALPTLASDFPLPQPLPLAMLRWETARDHLRSITLEWPQRLGEPSLQAAAFEWIHTCPLSLSNSTRASPSEVRTSLAALHEWLQKDEAYPAQCLGRWYAQSRQLAVPLQALKVLSPDSATQAQHLRQLGQAIAADSGFSQQPKWQGACAETGPWTRLRHAHQTASVSAWTRLEARWQELQDIARAPVLADNATFDPLLSSGALALGEGQAIAWCEMARGLLVHWLQLDSHGAVAQYRVLAPTEWNFHPQGALALALGSLGVQARAAAQTLAAAFDPCVACRVATSAGQEHANA